MPVLADGDYNYEIKPAKAETFDDVQVVAIPEEEAVSSKKVQKKKAKEAPSNPKHEEDTSALVGLEAMIKLESL